MPHTAALDWNQFLSAMALVLVRVSGMVVFAPFFSSTALPLRTKAVFVGAVAYLLAPLAAELPLAQVSITFSALLGELAVGLAYGLTLTLLTEIMLFAGQIAGMQFSFSAVNLIDPTSSIQTPLLGDLFQLMGTLVVLASGIRAAAGCDQHSFCHAGAASRSRLGLSAGYLDGRFDHRFPLCGADSPRCRAERFPHSVASADALSAGSEHRLQPPHSAPWVRRDRRGGERD